MLNASYILLLMCLRVCVCVCRSELKLATLKGKVQQLDEKERMRRLRAQAVGQQVSLQ